MPAPVITSFTATPASIQVGQESTLAWDVTGATNLSIDQGVGPVSEPVTVSPGLTSIYTLTAVQAVTVSNEPHTAASSVTITPPNSGTFYADGGVTTAAGTPLLWVSIAPTSGEYSVSSSGVYTFASADAGAALLITYAYTTAGHTSTATVTVTVAAEVHKLRRAVFGAPAPQQGVDHPTGTRFLFLGPPGQTQQPGILKVNIDPLWIGQQLHFKICSVNKFGGGAQSLSDVVDYTFTPIGVAQNQNPNVVNYTNTPAVALSLTNATTVHMAQVQVQFPGNTVSYNARDFTIASLNTTYYVTIADSGYLGDIGTALTRTAYCETTQAKVGKAGFTYVGSIGPAATAGGGTTPVTTPGGMPIAQLYLVNGQ